MKKMSTSSGALLEEIRGLIHAARSMAVRNINQLQVLTNFEVGRRIVEEEQKGASRAAYGKQMLAELAVQLTAEFGRGFSATNLKLMRQFYLCYAPKIGQTVSDQSSELWKSQIPSDQFAVSLSWSHFIFLISIENEAARTFYEIEAAEQNWSLRELRRQFDSGLYERLALSRDKAGIKELSKAGQIVSKPQDIIKNPYVLEFLGLDEKARFSETDLESAIISKLEKFLLELGKGFLFESRQKTLYLR